MKITNITKKTTLSDNVFEATSVIDKSLGLLDPKKPRSMLFRTRFGIHTLGMKKSIDVLVLNKTNRIVALRKNLKPYRIYLWNPRYDQVVELPQGTIHESQTELGDTVKILPNT